MAQDSLPIHLQDMINQDMDHLDDGQQDMALQLLTGLADVFSQISDDLGPLQRHSGQGRNFKSNIFQEVASCSRLRRPTQLLYIHNMMAWSMVESKSN